MNDYQARLGEQIPWRCPGSVSQLSVASRAGYTAIMEIMEDRQSSPVVDEVGALVAVARPVLVGVLQSISEEVVNTFGERDQLPLRMLGRLRKRGDGDCGIAFEYAVHDAVISADPTVVERVADALNKCRITRGNPASILFAIEKSGAQQLISTEVSLITENSCVLTGHPGRPVKLQKHLNTLAAAFRRPGTRLNLPQSIRGLWKADLFLGSTELDHWVGTTVKINPSQLEPARGLRVAIVPSLAGRSDGIRLDEQKNLVVCPMPHDGSFMQVFYEGWRIVQALCERDFHMPREVDIPNPTHREVARIFVERRDFPMADVIEATRKFAQPELLVTSTEVVSNVPFAAGVPPGTSTIITPFPLH